MTYIEFLLKNINHVEVGEPIYTSDLAGSMAKEYRMDINKAAAATGVAMKRILDGNYCPQIRFFQKGIYFRTLSTPFGEVGIDKEKLIRGKYTDNDTGYETGYAALYRLGLTTQMPAERVIATNKAKSCLRRDKNLGVQVRPPKTKITKENKSYLQILDAIELMDKAPVDTEKPYTILSNCIERKGLCYEKLLALADKYYSNNTVLKIAHIATAGDIL